MSRFSKNVFINGKLYEGYDYDNQAWVADGKYLTCGHPAAMNCKCFGKMNEGEPCQVRLVTPLKHS